jgi:hypothetical protein
MTPRGGVDFAREVRDADLACAAWRGCGWAVFSRGCA